MPCRGAARSQPGRIPVPGSDGAVAAARDAPASGALPPGAVAAPGPGSRIASTTPEGAPETTMCPASRAGEGPARGYSGMPGSSPDLHSVHTPSPQVRASVLLRRQGSRHATGGRPGACLPRQQKVGPGRSLSLRRMPGRAAANPLTRIPLSGTRSAGARCLPRGWAARAGSPTTGSPCRCRETDGTVEARGREDQDPHPGMGEGLVVPEGYSAQMGYAIT
jgi:hypothetical protein